MLLAEERDAVRLEESLHSEQGRRLRGYLRLTCEADDQGFTQLTRKGFRRPIHISKPYRQDNGLLVNVMSPTAGLLAGDLVEIEVRASAETSLVLSSPAALRIHKMDSGWASLYQRFEVESGGFLEVNPEWLILQGESRFSQRTSIEIEKGGALLFIESIAPGRIAYNEVFQFNSFQNHLKLKWGNSLSALERYSIEPPKGSHSTWQAAFEAPFFVSIFLVDETFTGNSDIAEFIYKLNTSTLLAGASRLAHGPCWNAKLLSPDPVEARMAIDSIRRFFYERTGRRIASLRR